MFFRRGRFFAFKMEKIYFIILVTALLLLLSTAFFRPQNVMTVQGGKPLAGQVIVLDPGHGGIDGGVHYGDSVLEKNINLELGLKLKEMLQGLGADVIITRDQDTDTSQLIPGSPDTRYLRDMQGRVKVINESGGLFFLSLHVNSCEDPSVRGSIVFYSDRFQENIYLAESVQKNLNKVVLGSASTSDFVHTKIKEGDFYLLGETNIPGVIVEVGFLTNPEERALLLDADYLKEMAAAISQGLVEYVDLLPIFADSWQKQEGGTIYAIFFD